MVRKFSELLCVMCDGAGGWPGLSGRVKCKPCDGTGFANDEVPAVDPSTDDGSDRKIN
jgi:DnaJ-class molecular chaperone